MFKLSTKSEAKMEGVHPDLVAVVKRAIEVSDVDFSVIEGLRTVARQKKLVAQGASKTMNSRHITGHAVDLAAYVDGQIRWDWPLYHKIGAAVKQAAKELEIKIEWGGDWKSFPDGPHFQLPHRSYPKSKKFDAYKPSQKEETKMSEETKNDIKNPLKSKTIWGVAIAFSAPYLSGFLGINLSEAIQGDILEVVERLFQIGGSVLAIYGRMVVKTKLG